MSKTENTNTSPEAIMARYKINSETGVTMFTTFKHPWRNVCRMAKSLADQHDEEMIVINTDKNSLIRIVRPTAWGRRDI